MSVTILNRASFSVVHKSLENAKWASLLLSFIKKYDAGIFPERYLSMLFQFDYYESQFSIYDAYGLACLHSEFGIGRIIYASLFLGETPSRDESGPEMNNKLDKLRHPFRGVFWGGTQYEDGALFVDEPIELSVTTAQGVAVSGYVSGRFPLEVGTTTISKTMFYLNNGINKLARWPYNSEYIYLLSRRLDESAQ